MLLDSLLRLLYSSVKVTGAQRTALLIAHRIEGYHLREIVAVTVFLLNAAINESL